VALSPELVALLVCPQDKGPLWYVADEDALYNERLRRRYQIDNGIPVLLVDEATTVSAEDHTRLVEKAAADGLVRTGTGPTGGALPTNTTTGTISANES